MKNDIKKRINKGTAKNPQWIDSEEVTGTSNPSYDTMVTIALAVLLVVGLIALAVTK